MEMKQHCLVWLGLTAFTWSLKRKKVVALSGCKAKYIGKIRTR